MQNRLKELRKNKKLSQKEFAKAFNDFLNKNQTVKDNNGNVKNISYATVSRWESGQTLIPSIYYPSLAEFFNINVFDLFDKSQPIRTKKQMLDLLFLAYKNDFKYKAYSDDFLKLLNMASNRKNLKVKNYTLSARNIINEYQKLANISRDNDRDSFDSNGELTNEGFYRYFDWLFKIKSIEELGVTFILEDDVIVENLLDGIRSMNNILKKNITSEDK